MLIHFIVLVSIIAICAFVFICDFHSQREREKSLDDETINLEANPSNFSLIRKFLKRLYSDDFEIDTFGSKRFATWGRIIKFYSEDECKHLDIKVEYRSIYLDTGIETRVLHSIHADLQDDSINRDYREHIFDINFVKRIDQRSEKYTQVKKLYKFVEYINKNFEKFEKRKQERLEEEMTREEQLERENIKRELACI